MPNFEESAEQGVLLPAGTPDYLILKMNHEIGKILNTAAVQQKLETMGMYPMFMSPDGFKAHVHTRGQSAGELIRRKHIVISQASARDCMVPSAFCWPCSGSPSVLVAVDRERRY